MGLDYQKWDQTPVGPQSTMLSPGLPGVWCAGQHMPSELPDQVSQLDPKQVPLSAVVVQYLHFRAGVSELRALPVCWHEAGWQWQPSPPTSWAHLEPSAWHKNQKKVGQCLPAGSGVVLAPGKVR